MMQTLLDTFFPMFYTKYRATIMRTRDSDGGLVYRLDYKIGHFSSWQNYRYKGNYYITEQDLRDFVSLQAGIHADFSIEFKAE